MAISNDFLTAVETQRTSMRSVLQKKVSTIAKVFSPKSFNGRSVHDKYMGTVDYESNNVAEVLPETGPLQYPDWSTRSSVLDESRIFVALPRKITQATGQNAASHAAALKATAQAAKERQIERQIGRLLSSPYQENPITDGVDISAQRVVDFPLANNRAGTYGSADVDGRVHFLDLMDIRRILANEGGNALTMSQYDGMPGVTTIDDMNTIMWMSNDAYFAFVAQNRSKYFNRDNSNRYLAAFDVDGFKVQSMQDSAILTTSQPLVSADSFAGTASASKRFSDAGVAVSSGGNQIASSDLQPIYIMKKGAFELLKPEQNSFELAVREIQSKSFNHAFYGECNVAGKRHYDQYVYRLWIDVNNKEDLDS